MWSVTFSLVQRNMSALISFCSNRSSWCIQLFQKIKSCQLPAGQTIWNVSKDGMGWDIYWCIYLQKTGHPRQREESRGFSLRPYMSYHSSSLASALPNPSRFSTKKKKAGGMHHRMELVDSFEKQNCPLRFKYTTRAAKGINFRQRVRGEHGWGEAGLNISRVSVLGFLQGGEKGRA
jgi:hypothetical protein